VVKLPLVQKQAASVLSLHSEARVNQVFKQLGTTSGQDPEPDPEPEPDGDEPVPDGVGDPAPAAADELGAKVETEVTVTTEVVTPVEMLVTPAEVRVAVTGQMVVDSVTMTVVSTSEAVPGRGAAEELGAELGATEETGAEETGAEETAAADELDTAGVELTSVTKVEEEITADGVLTMAAAEELVGRDGV
jgi:hypothetical protein